MKNSIFFLFYFLLVSPVFGQTDNSFYIYSDALYLKELKKTIDDSETSEEIRKEKTEQFFLILDKYGIDVKTNVFLKREDGIEIASSSTEDVFRLPNAPVNNANKKMRIVDFEKTFLQPIPIAGLESAAINSLAIFMEKRFKAELAAYFTKELRDRLEKDVTIKTMFPKTFQFLSLFSESIYTTDFLLIKAAAESDFNNIKYTFPYALLQKDKVGNKELAFAVGEEYKNHIGSIIIAFEFLTELKEKQNLGLVLNSLNKFSTFDSIFKEYLAAIKIFSDAIFDPQTGKYYDLSNGLRDISNLKQEERYFLALISAIGLKSEIGGSTIFKMDEIVKGNSAFLDKTRMIANIQKNFANIKEGNSDKVNFEEMRHALDICSNLISDISNGDIKPITGLSDLSKFNAIVGLITNIERVTLAKTDDKDNYKQYGKILSSIVFFMTEIQAKKEDQTKSDAALRTMLRNITVLSQFANIKDGEDMAKLLESSALPIGSSSIKRSAAFNIALNSYVGLQGSVDNYRNYETKTNFGLSAPIGVALSWSKLSNKKRLIASNSIFLSAIDLGTLVNYRLQTSKSIYNLDGLKFKYFQCYGFNWVWNLRKSPLSINLGGAYMPGFNEIQIGELNLSGTKSWRINGGLLVDIPIFNVVTKTKSKMKWKK